MSKRSFDELSVVATGVQSPEDRFGRRRRLDPGDVPSTFPWRCNLTGLSQKHNLYFVAYGPDIYVYVPQFPTQSVPSKPALIVSTQQSIPGHTGYLDQREPHAINNLIVQDLGTEEVVATVRDDGDVDAVLVRHMVQAIERRADPTNKLTLLADDVRPIFQSNVGISAWGLAIHTDARIIAVSSNDHEVRVFKFGLLHEDDASPDQDSGDGPRAEQQDDRAMDVEQRVINGVANIPCISFCNTGDDLEGRWLLTTDVSGICRVIDLHQSDQQLSGGSVQRFRFGKSSNVFASREFDSLNAGWTIMFLDTRSFEKEHELTSALGMSEGDELPGSAAQISRAWDLTSTIENLQQSDLFKHHNLRKQSRDVISSHTTSSSLPSTPQRAAGEDTLREGPDPMSIDQRAVDMIRRIVEEENHMEDGSSESDEDFDDDTLDLPEDVDFWEETEDSLSSITTNGAKRVFVNTVEFGKDEPLCNDLPCPILHTSVKNAFLLQPSSQKHTLGPFLRPMVGLVNPLSQTIELQHSGLNMIDRLNMNAYIPSLGVVILASQKGRVLILSLTKIPAHDAQYPASMNMEQGPKKARYAMRAEHILPFEDQEKKNQRPFHPLHGIAVGPVQGTEGLRDDRKRWRLLVMYQDHSILSYEIGRRRGAEAVDTRSVVV